MERTGPSARAPIFDMSNEEFALLTPAQKAAVHKQLVETERQRREEAQLATDVANGTDPMSLARRWDLARAARYEGESCNTFDSPEEMECYDNFWHGTGGGFPPAMMCCPCFLAHTLYLLVRPIWRRARKACRQ